MSYIKPHAAAAVAAHRMSNSASLQCAFCHKYLTDGPRQAPCGERLCRSCCEELGSGGKGEVTCPLCQEAFSLEDCFYDRAFELELASTTISCSNKGCSWEGTCKLYQDHISDCGFALVPCSNSCGELVRKSKLKEHLACCPNTSQPCEWCGDAVTSRNRKVHLKDCEGFPVKCPSGCEQTLLRKEMGDHLERSCPRHEKNCSFSKSGCTFKGNPQELCTHEEQATALHIKCVNHHLSQQTIDIQAQLEANAKKIEALQNDFKTLQEHLSHSLQPLVDSMVKVESSIQQLQEGFGEMALIVQTLQATSYNGCFVWKIPDVARRRREAKLGKVISLYSAPFYTSRHGYKMCLRLYMDGDGGGKGSHLSFFLTLMKGEYDALLPWPFRQTVSLLLLDQDRQKDVIQSFRPDPVSSSFQRPRNEMNVASGCPLFAPLSVLDNPSYVKDDTLFMKCKIDISGLNGI